MLNAHNAEALQSTQGGILPVQAIRAFAGPVPAVLLLGAIAFAWAYPITRASHQATVAELAGREG